MINEAAVWLIFLLPLASFVAIVLVIRPFFNRHAYTAGHLTIGAVGASLILSLWALGSLVARGEGTSLSWTHDWMEIGSFDFNIGLMLDPLTAIMLVVATGVSLMVQIYSTGYMKGDPGYARYYAYMSLFTASMIGLVLASNLVQLFVFWELVGLCSYLLIGFWYHKPSAAAAAKKAFIVTRIGDFGFLLGIMYLFFNGSSFGPNMNPLEITDINNAVSLGLIGGGAVTWIALGIFAGAVGKSAQLPLHTWLPDAMEGPTPVSALIHAATMVAAGVFLVARFFPVFEASPAAMDTVAIVGGVTALFAASMGLVMNDIKRVLAYSTISQLGFMMLALGVGALAPAIFHLFTHAFFKALLFLGSGSVNHATGTFDMRYMGGLRKAMPWTYITFLIGGLSLAGIFPLAGFWSKDEILADAWRHKELVSQTVFWLGMAVVFMTAFYIFRALFMTFQGDFRGGAESDPDAEPHGEGVHLAESPPVMVWPLWILAAGAVLAGFAVNPIIDLGIIPGHWFTDFMGAKYAPLNVGLAVVSTVLAAAGIGLAYLMYGAKRVRMPGVLAPLHQLLYRKYYLDEVYEVYGVRHGLYNGLARALDWTDKAVIDRTANTVGWVGANIGNALRQAQTGQLQAYGMAISVGILAMLGLYLFFF